MTNAAVPDLLRFCSSLFIAGEHALATDKQAQAQTAKSIIDQIPTDQAELFAFTVNWGTAARLLDEKMLPWVKKKIIEYLGEEEPTLTQYLVKMLKERKAPAEIIKEVSSLSALARTSDAMSRCWLALV